MDSTEMIPFLILISVLLVGAVIDIRFHKILNWLTYPAMIMGVTYHSLTKGYDGFLFSIGGVAIGIAVLIGLFLMGRMGAGDVKFMGAVGGLIGPRGVLVAFLFAAIVGGIYALLLWASHKYLKKTVKRYEANLKTFIFAKQFTYTPKTEKGEKPKLRYGVAIAVGTMISVAWGNLILK